MTDQAVEYANFKTSSFLFLRKCCCQNTWKVLYPKDVYFAQHLLHKGSFDHACFVCVWTSLACPTMPQASWSCNDSLQWIFNNSLPMQLDQWASGQISPAKTACIKVPITVNTVVKPRYQLLNKQYKHKQCATGCPWSCAIGQLGTLLVQKYIRLHAPLQTVPHQLNMKCMWS